MITWFLPPILKHKRLFAQILLAGLTLKLLALVTPFVFQAVIDRVLVTRGLSTLDVLFAALVLAAIIDAFLSGARNYLLAHTINCISADLSSKLNAHLFALPLSYFQRWRIGEIISRTRELDTIRRFITSTSMNVLMDMIFVFIFPAVLLMISPTLSIIVFLSIPLQVAVYFGFGPFVRARNQEQFLAGAQHQSRMVEALAGIETVKSLGVEPKIREALEGDLAGNLYASFRSRKLSIVSSETSNFVGRITEATILFFGARLVIDGQMTLGELIAFNMISGYVSGPMMRLAELWEDWQQIRVSLSRFGDILNEPTEVAPLSTETMYRPQIDGEIRIESLEFRYHADRSPVLEDVSLEIGAGQVIGIVGSSGSGKSTLVKVIARLLMPQSGRILIDGLDAARVDLSWLRSKLAYVPQDTVIFNSTVAVNLALARPEASIEQIHRAAELACAHDFIKLLPHGYDTPLGERGINLSGGQRQRLAIARALVADPKILLLDEATSALDVESEQAIINHLREIGEGRTMIIVSHRLSVMQRTDNIFALDVGRIAEQGSHASLCARNGRYAGMLRLQAGQTHAK